MSDLFPVLLNFLQDPNGPDQVLNQVQPGLFFSKPNFGIFVVAHYKDKLRLNNAQMRNNILQAARDIIEFSLSLSNKSVKGNSFPPLSYCFKLITVFSHCHMFEVDFGPHLALHRF